MELQQLKSFLAVARLGSFSKAAQELFRTQPGVTMAVQGLEKELKTRLLERSGRTTRLSDAGKALQELAAPLVAEFDRLPERLQESLSKDIAGTVRIGAGQAAVHYLLPEPVRQFRKKYPNSRVIVLNQSAEESQAMLKAGGIDIALRSEKSIPAGLQFTPCWRFDRVLIGPKGHPVFKEKALTVEGLARYPLVMPWERSRTRRLMERLFEEKKLILNIAVQAGGWEIIKRYVALGLGLAVMPAFCVEPQDRKILAFRSAKSLFGEEVYGLLEKSGRAPTRAAEAFRHLLKTISA